MINDDDVFETVLLVSFSSINDVVDETDNNDVIESLFCCCCCCCCLIFDEDVPLPRLLDGPAVITFDENLDYPVAWLDLLPCRMFDVVVSPAQ